LKDADEDEDEDENNESKKAQIESRLRGRMEKLRKQSEQAQQIV